MATRARAGRWRNGAIALGVFVLVSLGIGPKVIDYFFADAVDNVADQLSSVAVRVVSLSDNEDPTFNQAWAFAEPGVLGQAPATEARVLRAIRDHGVPVGGRTIQFIVESNRARDLTVVQMRARVVRTIPPPAGTLLLPRSGGGPEEVPVVKARFELGGPDPRAYDGREPGRLLLGDRKLVLQRDDQMILEVTGVAVACSCDWVVDIDLAIGSELRTITVPDTEHPLRLTGPVSRYRSVYQMSMVFGEGATPLADPAAACQGDCVTNPPPWRQGA